VYFAYEHGYRTLNDINLRVESGQFAALVGPTGAGKTTIASLIGRFYDPTKGVVKIDGNDVRSYKLKSLRRQMSFVLQETLLSARPSCRTSLMGARKLHALRSCVQQSWRTRMSSFETCRSNTTRWSAKKV
jgi:ABC-type transport system involved in Fe-S cluster assembly fused permease/ATPase subunit